jgi:hypothetical protein
MGMPRVPHAAWEVCEVNCYRSSRGLPTQSERCNSYNDSIRTCTLDVLLPWPATSDPGVCVTCEPLRTGFYRREELQKLFRFTALQLGQESVEKCGGKMFDYRVSISLVEPTIHCNLQINGAGDPKAPCDGSCSEKNLAFHFLTRSRRVGRKFFSIRDHSENH